MSHSPYQLSTIKSRGRQVPVCWIIVADRPGWPREREWELFDLEKDPCEMHSVYDDPAYADTVKELKTELRRLQDKLGDKPYEIED